MLARDLISFLFQHWPLAFLATFVFYLLRNKFHNGLHKYPGPLLAAYTNWWRFCESLGRKTERTHIALHRKYGDVIRLGPNVLSFADPKAIKVIYGLNKGMTKSDFYPVQQAVANGRRLQSLFSTQNEEYHARYRRCINHAFSMSSLVDYEDLVDSTTDAFIVQTQRRYCETGQVCNFSKWLQFFAFDVVGELTWSKRIGFVDRDEDVDGIVSFISKFLAYAGPIGQMPFLDLLWEKNPVKLLLQRWGVDNAVFPVTKFALDRRRERETVKQGGRPDAEHGGVDLLTKFNKAQHDHPEFMTDSQVLASCTSMIFAGSETTAISLSSVFHFLLRYPRVYSKLMKELDTASSNGTIADRENGKVSWTEAQKLPYLDAVIQESFRLHPAAGLMLERVVPPQGMDILGHFVPGGTIVGCNAWVLQRRPEVFGADVDVFRPERWIEASPAQLAQMKATMFQFGAGARTCLGKNISTLEMYKLIPTFLRNFEISEYEPEKFSTFNGWFVRQLNFKTTFRARERSST